MKPDPHSACLVNPGEQAFKTGATARKAAGAPADDRTTRR